MRVVENLLLFEALGYLMSAGSKPVRVLAAQAVRDHLPRGSGFDMGSSFEPEESGPGRLCFMTHFHHMNEVGFYTGWTSHTVIVRSVFFGAPEIVVRGRNFNRIKDLVSETFAHLSRERFVLCVNFKPGEEYVELQRASEIIREN